MAKWIEFVLSEEKPKTKVWTVEVKENGDIIGTVKWYSGWRKYAFFPEDNTVYENDCLRDIADFIEKQMRLRKEGNTQ
jgi:hypothetical protein